MTDYIRKAVELADGWKLRMSALTEDVEVVVPPVGVDTLENTPNNQMFMDALAAQLVRQVDEHRFDKSLAVVFERWRTAVYKARIHPELLGEGNGDTRTMNTIKAIIDSGVLSEQ